LIGDGVILTIDKNNDNCKSNYNFQLQLVTSQLPLQLQLADFGNVIDYNYN